MNEDEEKTMQLTPEEPIRRIFGEAGVPVAFVGTADEAIKLLRRRAKGEA